MKSFFLHQFYIRNITTGNDKIILHCYGVSEEESFYFSFSLNHKELWHLLNCMKATGKRIMRWLKGALSLDLVERLREAVRVDNFWLTIRVTETSENELPVKQYLVENYGFIPE